MEEDEFASRVVPLLGETAGVEFKRAGTLDELLSKVVRATLAMANRRNGGLIVVGVEEVQHQLRWTGVTNAQAATWVSDHFADKVAVYADPSVSCQVSTMSHDGNSYVTVEVDEFDTVPVVCKKSGNGLREGAIYVRPRRKPESVETPTAADARDLLDLAAEKLTRSFLGTAERVGLLPATPAQPNDEALFDAQIDDLLK